MPLDDLTGLGFDFTNDLGFTSPQKSSAASIGALGEVMGVATAQKGTVSHGEIVQMMRDGLAAVEAGLY